MAASGFSVYDASAGSGKTYTLVKEYLKIILGHPSDDAFKAVLAITFTNKAAKEMKTRIVEALVSFAKNDLENPSPLFVEVAETLKKNLTSLKDKAHRVLQSLLHNYTAFEVSTIDTFTVKIIRTFANDLRLAQAFEIELDTDRLYQLAIDELLSGIGKDDLLTKFMVEFVLQEVENDKNWDVSKQLLDVIKKLENENDQAHFAKLTEKTLPDFLKLIRLVSDRIKSSQKNLTSKAQDALDLIEESGLVHGDFSSGYLPKHFLKIISDPSKVDFTAKWKNEIETTAFYSKAQKENIKSIIEDIRPKLIEYFNLTKQIVLSLRLYENILKNIRPMAVLNNLSQHYKDMKAELQLVTLPEANSLIWEQVRNQPVPFIYERMGQKYKHFFIDEFQDTSQRQWQNLIPLLDHALSNFDAQNQNGNVLLVGDAKQSIYRWRGGYPEQFIDLGNGKSPFPHSIPEKFALDTNYRSLFEIVDFNNRFFTHIASFLENEAYKNLYLNGNHQKSNSANNGLVSIDFLTAKNETEREEIYLPCILDRVREITNQGFQASDICILVRKKKYGTLIANYLTENGLQVISEENLLLSNNPETAFLADWLKLLHQPETRRRQTRFHLLTPPFISLGTFSKADRHGRLSKFRASKSLVALRLYRTIGQLFQTL
jgi:ATP-dependent exoDNAse (exonuclease V) beta subunit